MNARIRHWALLAATLFFLGNATAQTYLNDFEDISNQSKPWTNINVVEDSTAYSGSHICLCDTMNEFGFGADIDARQLFSGQSLNCQFGFLCKWQKNDGGSLIVVSIDNEKGNLYWNSYPISDFAKGENDWFPISLDLNFPTDYLKNSIIKIYLWNLGKDRISIDDTHLSIRPIQDSYLPKTANESEENDNPLQVIIFQDNKTGKRQVLSHPIANLFEYISGNDTITESSTNWKLEKESKNCKTKHYTLTSSIGETYLTETEKDNERIYKVETHFNKDCKLLRQVIVIPFADSISAIYRRNQKIDSLDFQNEYYLDREGFVIGKGERSIATYHNTEISSLQFDATNRTAYFNIDYWRDHPLIHYPLRNDTSDFFQNISCKTIDETTVLKGEFALYIGTDIQEMPRIMPIWDGYESAFIFTEHADWTDIRTHRAVVFGNENITRPEEAVGGFAYYGIPVTKSVFFSNPDSITNYRISKGKFPGLHATVKTDESFYRMLKSLKDIGFEICLHTPEQYTTNNENLGKALRMMRRRFGSPTWIDHGYNNSAQSNRENLVCDGLIPDSPQYAARLWKRNKIKYLWNAYYEENRMEQLIFDAHFVQPYDGFGDALPNRQITSLPNDDHFRLWSTPSTLEINDDGQWYFFFDSKHLQHLADNHIVFITHTYPAWSNPDRAFWQYDEDSTAVAMPGFNFALQQIANLRDEKKMLPTTIQDYLSFYESLLKVDYKILNDKTIELYNKGQDIEGFTILSEEPIYIFGKEFSTRQTEEGFYTWFDLYGKEKIKILK